MQGDLLTKFRRKRIKVEILTFKEEMNAELMWIENLKESSFLTDKKQLKIEYRRNQPNPRIHAYGIIRVHGRMTNADLPEKKITLIQPKLPRWSITHSCADKKLPEGQAQVKQVLAKCLTCIKHQGGPNKTKPMAPWPKIKVNESTAFTDTGLDNFGPFFVKNGTVRSKA